MNALKKLFPMTFALLFATLATMSVYQYLKDRESVSIAKPDITVPVVISKRDLPMGTKLTDDDLSVESWPKELAAEHYFRSPKMLIGQTLRTSVTEFEPIVESKLMKEEDNLSNLIPSDMRGVTIPVRKSDAMAKFLERDSIVDVIAMFEDDKGIPTTKVVAVGAKVLAVHRKKGPEEKDASILSMEVTLVVTPREAEWLIIAMNKGETQIVVRNTKKQAA